MQNRVAYRVALVFGALSIVSLFATDALGFHAKNPGAAGLGPLGYLAWYLVGAFAYWRRPEHPVARMLALVGSLFIVEGALGYELFQVAARYGPLPWLWAANAVEQFVEWEAYVAWVALLAVYPDGAREGSSEGRLIRVLFVIGAAVPVLLLLSFPVVQVDPWFIWIPHATSPIYVSTFAGLGTISSGLWWARFPLILIGVALLILRTRHSRDQQLRQVQWALFGTLLYVALNFLPVDQLARLVGEQPKMVGELPWEIAFTLMPFALVVAIFKHRLLDIELVIRKSIVYGLLWLCIALSYVGVTALLGIAAGQRVPVGLAVLVTIAATLVFGPARKRLEDAADRWVFGERVSGYELLRRFGVTLEGTLDLDQLAPRVADTIRQGLDLQWVRISLYDKKEAGVPSGGSALTVYTTMSGQLALNDTEQPQSSELEAIAPLIYGDELIGRIECGPKREGHFEARDHDLLQTLGRQASLALRNSRLVVELAHRLEEIRLQADELAASRTRIVQAQDAERRRIERNIHDGVQQQIVALLTKIRLARNQLSRDTTGLGMTLTELQEETRQTLEDLRELARGIHPPVLSDRGLLEAIEARAAHLPLGVNIEADTSLRETRFAHEIEGAAYFLISEGLANILKHATAHRAIVRLSSTEARLVVEVADDGKGFDPAIVSGTGLSGLADRIEALGGILEVVSRPHEGTRLIATLPVDVRNPV